MIKEQMIITISPKLQGSFYLHFILYDSHRTHMGVVE